METMTVEQLKERRLILAGALRRAYHENFEYPRYKYVLVVWWLKREITRYERMLSTPAARDAAERQTVADEPPALNPAMRQLARLEAERRKNERDENNAARQEANL